MDLTIRDRRTRVIMASQHILASNVCPKCLEKDRMDYLKKQYTHSYGRVCLFECYKIVHYSRCDENKYKHSFQL